MGGWIEGREGAFNVGMGEGRISESGSVRQGLCDHGTITKPSSVPLPS